MNDKKLMSAAGLNEVREWLRSNYHVPHQVVANMLAHIAALEEQLAAVNECSVAHERVLQHEIDELKRNYDHWRNIATLAQRDTAERVAAVIERTLEILHADDYDDGEYTHQFSSWAHLEIAIRALAPNAEQILAQSREDSTVLGNLLAVIHGDGGHYQGTFGSVKAGKDAEAKYVKLMVDYEDALAQLKKESK